MDELVLESTGSAEQRYRIALTAYQQECGKQADGHWRAFLRAVTATPYLWDRVSRRSDWRSGVTYLDDIKPLTAAERVFLTLGCNLLGERESHIDIQAAANSLNEAEWQVFIDTISIYRQHHIPITCRIPE